MATRGMGPSISGSRQSVARHCPSAEFQRTSREASSAGAGARGGKGAATGGGCRQAPSARSASTNRRTKSPQPPVRIYHVDPMSPNQRRHRRVRARGLAAHLRTEHGKATAMVENISLGGLFVRTDKLQEGGTEFFVDVLPPGWKRALTLQPRITSRVDAPASRISKRPPVIGMQFLPLDDEQPERLR